MLDVTTLAGALVVAAGGLIMGSSVWPYKLMRKYQFEHWWFVSGVVGLVVMPWTIALLGCHHPLQALRSLPVSAIILGNLFALGWGIANVLCGLCYYRIGVALTGAVLSGLGASAGAIVPMIFKGSGRFQDAPDLGSPAGMAVLARRGRLVGRRGLRRAGRLRPGPCTEEPAANLRRFPGRADHGRDLGSALLVHGLRLRLQPGPDRRPFQRRRSPRGRSRSRREPRSRNARFPTTAAVEIAGVGPVQVGGLTAAAAAERIADRIRSARPGDPPEVRIETGSITATFAVFAVGLVAGALLNIGYAIHRLNRNKSWHVLLQSGREFMLAIVIGINFSLAVTLMGKGMLLLGALGASIGWGIQQAMQMTGGQMLGFVSGEWHGVSGTPRLQMYLAIALLIAAGVVLAYGNTLAK